MPYLHCPDRPALLDAAFTRDRYAALTARAEEASRAPSPEPWLALYEDWNELKSYVRSEGSRRRYRLSQNMDDPEADALDRAHREEITPLAEEAESALLAALLDSPHRDAIADRYGAQLLRSLEIQKQPLAPVNSELRVTEGQLGVKYDKLVASAEVEVQGERLTLPRARGLLTSADGATRKAAFEAYYGWFLEHRDELAGIYSEQVALRTRMGRNLGHDTYTPLGYACMSRTDYGPAEAEAFREAVLAHASPLLHRAYRAQAAALGCARLAPWDKEYHPGLSLPRGVAQPIAQQLDKAGRVFAALSPRLAEHFRRMRALELIDLENRKGKRAGAFCTAFHDEAKVAIFCNSIGDEGDVRTLMHEMGHAFQAWESQGIDAIDLRWPTADAAEVHSMGMEYLSLPHLGEFFGPEQLERFTRGRWQRAVELICYVALVDAFQHWVYAHPEADAADRDATWATLADRFMPGLDWSQAEAWRATRWYAQLHIFRYPFYYIDYAIAETGAMQLGLLDSQDSAATLQTYLELCRRGGTGSVLELFAGAGLRSPFDAESMARLMEHAAGVLAV